MPDPRQTSEDASETVPVPRLSSEPPRDPIDSPSPDSGAIPPDSGPEPKRKRRGRRSKAEIEAEKAKAAEPAPVDPAELEAVAGAIGMGFQIASGVIARQRGAHWQLAQEETALLGQAWATALAPWLGKVAGALPWTIALGTTYAIVAPRLEADRKAVADLPPGSVPIDPPKESGSKNA